MRGNNGKTVLITGASSGIGAAFADLFAREGYDLVLVVRTGEKLLRIKKHIEDTYSVRTTLIVQDLAEMGAARKVSDALLSENITIDMLVNNAGLGSFGPFYSEDLIRERELLMVNVCALTELTRHIVPGMIARRTGRILNVGSIASFVPGPSMAVYFASKAYVLSFSEGLAEELRGTGVSVTVLCPGPTRTNFFTQNGAKDTTRYRDPSFVARYGYSALMRGASIAMPDRRYAFMFFLQRFLPRWLVVRIVARII